MASTVTIQTFDPKDPDEVIWLGVDFAALLDVGETIATATVGIRTATGADVGAAMLSGTESVNGSLVRQLVKAGSAGATYRMSFAITTSAGQTIVEGVSLPVVARD